MPPGHEYPITPSSPPSVPEVVSKGWVHSHPYIAAAIATVSILTLVAGIVAQRSGVAGSDRANNWVGAGGIFSGGPRATPTSERMTAEEILKNRSVDTALPYIPLPMRTTDGSTEDFGNLNELLSLLTTPPSGGTNGVDVSSAFAFIPQGLVTPQSVPKLTPEQSILFEYGNNVGNAIQSFESLHGNNVQIMKDQAEDRGDGQKSAALKQLGYDMALLGRDLLDLQEVPASVKAAHDAFATSYRITGTNLTKIADAKTDEEFLDAVTAYNASVEALTKRYIVLVGLFSAHNVTFSSSDPGSIFMFSASPSF